MAIRIRRRRFIVTLGSMAVARPLAPQARARGLRKLLWGLSIAAAAIGNAEAQQYPSRPITIVVPGAAGGPGDALARLVAEPMRASLGQQIIIENVSGANGTIGRRRRTRSVHSGCVGCGSEPRNDELAGAETVFMVERNMCDAVMRGIVVPPGSRATSRAKGSRRKLGYLVTGRQRRVRGTVRIGKVRSRSR